MSEKKEATIKVPKTDPEREEKENFEEKERQKEIKGRINATAEKEKELSEEDAELKKKLDEAVDAIVEKTDSTVVKNSLELVANEIKTSTSSMTSVPKPLKFLRPQWERLKDTTQKLSGENQKILNDILSVIGMTIEGERLTLKYKLAGNLTSLAEWGHEYIRLLTGQISEEYEVRQESKAPVDDLNSLVDQIVPFHMKSHSEHEAVDLLLEIEQLDRLKPFIDSENYQRVGLYLTQCANYLPEPDDTTILKLALFLYLEMKNYPQALRIAMRLNDKTVIRDVFDKCEDEEIKKQLCFMLGRQHVFFEDEDDMDTDLVDIISNSNLSQHFLTLGQDLDIMEPKTPEDVYKSDSPSGSLTTNVESARANLASTFVNAFVNAGFGQDKLVSEDANKWIYKNREHGMMSAVASLGMVLLWDVNGGLTKIDKFSYSTEDWITAGSLLANGIINCGVRSEVDPALSLLQEHIDSPSNAKRIGAGLGLGLAYAGSAREDLATLLLPIIEDTNLPMDVIGLTALSLGLIFVGTADGQVAQALVMCLIERDDSQLNITHSRFIALAIGLVFLAKQEQCEVILETLKTITHEIGSYAQACLETCAYCGTGNVLKIQKLLDSAGDHPEKEKDSKDSKEKDTKDKEQRDKNTHQAVNVIGIALIAMGEEIGSEMALRSFEHLLQYGEVNVRRAVPLALGLLSISNPRITLSDTLNKLAHDQDEEVCLSAIFALGLIGAGTNNARIAGLLRTLANYYQKEPNYLFVVRIAQGFIYMGKGTMSLAPYHSEKLLLSPVAVAGILSVLHACLDIKQILLSDYHYLLYCLVTAMHPRMMMTLDEQLEPLSVPVRVGQAVDVIGQAGKPKTITGFQTHTSPVLLGYSDRAELATEEYIPLTDILEGFVILKKNPDYVPDEDLKSKKGKEEK